jgi:PAS domain S-box-containing protein
MQPTNLRLLTTDGRDRTPTPEPPADNGSAHIVHFYDNDDALTATVADFLAEGLVSNEPLVVIATQAHREAVLTRLRSKGFDLEYLRRAGRFVLLDASGTLSQLMDGGMPDPGRFNAHVGSVIERTRRDNGHATIRAYGEMVDLLWQQGNTVAAIRLEELWNELGGWFAMSLLCAYAAGPSYVAIDHDALEEVKRQHTHVVRGDADSSHEAGAWLPAYRMLEQRAQALEREIEQRKELERRLREALGARSIAEEELRQFLDTAAEGIHRVNREGTILWANRAELELLGYTADEYVGHHFAEFHDDAVLASEILARLAARETLHGVNARLRCKDGSIKHVLINANVRWVDDEFVYTRCFTRDITELTKTAAEREALLVLEREARAEAEAANRAKTEFLSIMSHELRTPLNAIGGYVQLLALGLHGPITDAQRTALDRVERSQQHLLALINDILNLSRIESGRVDYAIEEFAIVPMVDDVVAILEPMLASANLTCDADGLREQPELTVHADSEKVRQILLNLLTNAIKYTPSGGRISVRAGRAATDAPAVSVVVQDTGVGIDPAKLEAVFEPFVQLNRKPSRQFDGVGLGLAISRDLARGMGGELRASSAIGQGATFELVLPAAAVAAADAPPAMVAGDAPPQMLA